MAIRTRTPIRSLTAVVIFSFAIAGCANSQAGPLPEESASPRPLFASDEEALEAAKSAYAKYLDVESVIGSEGGIKPERIAEVAVRDALEESLKSSAQFRRERAHAVGRAEFTIAGLQQYNAFPTTRLDVVSAYVCLDVSSIDIRDADDISLVSPDRPNIQSLQVNFDSSKLSPVSLVVSSSTGWAGTDTCGD